MTKLIRWGGLAASLTWTLGTSAQSVATDVRPGNPASTPVTANIVDVPLMNALQTIARQSGLHLIVGKNVLGDATRVSMRVQGVSVEAAFAKALTGTGMTAKITGSFVTIVKDVITPMSQGSITGKVIDAKTQQGVRGATISLNATTGSVRSPGSTLPSTTTRDDGTFRVSGISVGTYTVQVRMLGYVRTSKTVTVNDGQAASIEIALEPSVNALDQVVVTGTVIPTAQKAVPNAMTVITAKDIEQRGITQIQQLFRGDVPGLFAQNRGADSPVDAVTMFSRGTTAFPDPGFMVSAGTARGTNPIKTYVDGVELADPQYLSQIDPTSIERIEIVTGPQASTIYGSNAINGVMQIFTKRSRATRPHGTLNVLSGIIQSQATTAFTPNHTGDARLTGVEGAWSYSLGGSANYVGAWTPAKQTSRLGVDGGAKRSLGAWSLDASARRGWTRNRQRGSAFGRRTLYSESGFTRPSASNGMSPPITVTLDGQTVGMTLAYTPWPIWSHELVLGVDQSRTETIQLRVGNRIPSDTLLSLAQGGVTRTSQRYSNTFNAQAGPLAHVTMTAGIDHWRTRSSSISARPTSLVGTLASATINRDLPGKNTGGFAQAQLAFADRLFFTGGIRAEWNPNYGDAAQPNLAPRYGVAYTHESNAVTLKIRGSYGRSTRPPLSSLKGPVHSIAGDNVNTITMDEFGPYDLILYNPDLGPEYQQGGEGGLELYFGNRASVVITRYNQTVDQLVNFVYPMDSVRSLQPNPTQSQSPSYDADGYGYVYQVEYLNVGSIRNQGWELQGSVTAGPLVLRGTYSWTKSRVIGITPKYRALLTGTAYEVGRPFDYLPEHTWATSITYSNPSTTLILSTNGIGQLFLGADALFLNTGTLVRLPTTTVRVGVPSNYRSVGRGYVLADLNGSHRFSSRVEGVIQVFNLTNWYQSDVNIDYMAIGRQSKVGLRLRW